MTQQPRFEEVYDRVVEIVAKELHVSPDKIAAGTLIFEQLGADSLDAVSIAMKLEERFGIHIPNEEIPNFRTPGAIAEGIRSSLPR